MTNIQFLIRENVGQVYIEVSNITTMENLLHKLDRLNFFINSKGFVSRNKFVTPTGSIKCLILNLKSKEIAFNRSSPNDELRRTNLFINEYEEFIMNGPKVKLRI